ncbi:MAG: glycoside hydrolase family 127 protein [Clostridia bacterium]|nr:glycoside hydrolase family 127 protein [Clostridia bacterium]
MNVRNGAKVVHGATIDGGFWKVYRETVAREGITYQWKALNDEIPDASPSGCMRNFRIASGREQGGHTGFVFQDSDAYKWLEAVAYCIRWKGDEAMEALADEAIETIAAAQQPDGYLDTYYIINGLEKRWTNLKNNHELYCAGHMIEAAVAYYQATGKRRLLDVALRFVDHINSVIGPEEGKLHGYPGHPVIEMALMRLYEVTGDEKHLRLAKYFVDQRGQEPLYFREEDKKRAEKNSWGTMEYYQAHKPVREQTEAVGHAVRAMYLYSGMADVARVTDDETLKAACVTLWNNTTRRRMYVTGAVGSTEYGEAFSFDDDLPNDTVYGETCAAIGLVFFARRMLQLRPSAEYADVMERALYNGVISGMDLDGKRFFYVNPLEVWPEACEKDPHKKHVVPQRQKWFGCACCPPNLFRLISSLEDYVAVEDDGTLYVNLYAKGTLNACSGALKFAVETDYPWDGAIRLNCLSDQPAEGVLALRVSGWCKKYTLCVNGEPVKAPMTDGYVRLKRAWKADDQVDLVFDMPVRYVRANPRVREDVGKVALMRGPLCYCLEQADNGDSLHLLKAVTNGETRIERADMLGGITLITAQGEKEVVSPEWNDTLYAEADAPATVPKTLTFIPYYAWANRGLGEMSVWVRS